ncbi:type II secretion protein F [Thermococcus litoralis DSM 5473]|uniref:Type II secretion protein F n=1 Tax=Thermococcus litoralis (strain ATCC 51850 / DSM 5473 / JCM 8560 / NS-C) TaxID=523849 RepID=H3ZR66_THELN|nr:type II secretion system F family protein [Thermococcus litoralis]EHR77535.1 type II secretion protein F [Thermococcus litoralis DSM 5473]
MAEIKFLRPLAKALEKLLPTRWVRRYELFLYSAGISFLALEFLLVSLLLAGLVGIIAFILSPVKIYALPVFLGLFLGIAWVYPYYLLTKKIEDMEKNLPDAFFYLASSLRAGVSFSEALEEASTARFGALTEEFKRTVQEIKKGRATIEALRAFAVRNKRSSVIYRSTMIIIEAYERGAPMADVLVAVANDVREILRIKKERKASTGMQAMFFIIASGFIGPFILGVVSQIMGGMNTPEVGLNLPLEAIKNVSLAFVAIQAIVSGLGIGIIREGKFSAGFKYSAMLAILGVVIFLVATRVQISGFI